MIYVEKARDNNGVYLVGDFFDLGRLYFAIYKFTGFHGIDNKCVFPYCEELCVRLLGLCYEIRHAWQGNRGLKRVYNGIHSEWFDDYKEAEVSLSQDSNYDYDEEDEDKENKNASLESVHRFPRDEFPEANEYNTCFSIRLSFPEAMYYALILSDLLVNKHLFYQTREMLMQQPGLNQELNKEYYCFGAEADVARLTLFVNQTFNVLYRFIGDRKYFKFMNNLKRSGSFSINCNMNTINLAIADYDKEDLNHDDPENLMHTLVSFLW